MDRRRFLVRSSVALASTPIFSPFIASADTVNLFHPPPGEYLGISPEQWAILEAVQAHLLPTEADAPGAVDVNALAYLRLMLGEPGRDMEDRLFIKDGAKNLGQLAKDKFGEKFTKLNFQQRETVLRSFETELGGSGWISSMLDYVLEALLTDPVYGGNPDGIGWRWLDHTPGFPRPPADKRYFFL